ncbi:hypothetical protein [Oceanobacillus oncorhynchi]|uniref:hypothetical protein n=1 Tax=Oceanobacillus oncorhynchi TaxID=545501 RepID=UPI0034D58974
MKNIKNIIFFIILLVLAVYLLYTIFQFFNNKGFELDFYSKLSAISTTVAAVGGLILLSLTYLTYRETKNQRIAQEEPVVTLRLITDEKISSSLNFHLKNTGGGPAYDLQVSFTPDLPYGNTSLNKLNMFNRMPLLEKGEEITFFFDTAINYFHSNNPTAANAKILYYTLPKDNKNTRKLERNIEIKLDERMGQRHIMKKDMNDLINEIEEIKHLLAISKIEQDEKND